MTTEIKQTQPWTVLAMAITLAIVFKGVWITIAQNNSPGGMPWVLWGIGLAMGMIGFIVPQRGKKALAFAVMAMAIALGIWY